MNESSAQDLEVSLYKNATRHEEYKQKKKKFIKSAINSFEEVVGDDQNTLNIFCELLTRFILTLFNSKPNTAFPEEGNTLNYEIRLYKDENDAEKPKGKKYTILTPQEVLERLTAGEDLNLKIRIVNNEGYRVTHTIEALSCLNAIFEHITEDFLSKLVKDLKIYNSKYLKYIEEDPLTAAETTIQLLTEDERCNLVLSCAAHIAKHLYGVFDFKPLEKKVFVPLTKTDIKYGTTGVKVFPSADGEKIAIYGIKVGQDYREDKINSATGYNKYVKYRGEEPDLNLLAQKIIEHLIVSLSPYPYLVYTDSDSRIGNYPLKILEHFLQLIVRNYNIALDELEKNLSEGKQLIINIFNTEVHSSESEVEPHESHPYQDDSSFMWGEEISLTGES